MGSRGSMVVHGVGAAYIRTGVVSGDGVVIPLGRFVYLSRLQEPELAPRSPRKVNGEIRSRRSRNPADGVGYGKLFRTFLRCQTWLGSLKDAEARHDGRAVARFRGLLDREFDRHPRSDQKHLSARLGIPIGLNGHPIL